MCGHPQTARCASHVCTNSALGLFIKIHPTERSHLGDAFTVPTPETLEITPT